MWNNINLISALYSILYSSACITPPDLLYCITTFQPYLVYTEAKEITHMDPSPPNSSQTVLLPSNTISYAPSYNLSYQQFSSYKCPQ